ncbi:unnamed protein product [Coffea canephora]|uniref:NB-ARC domain-containing protein n=1 Tax=Coffea canephora TaxID=49390 RepID=A0A068UIH1_COFCA|nr:unnamed protein product [Coffea canephora]
MWSRGGGGGGGGGGSFVLDLDFCKYLLLHVRLTVSAIGHMAAKHWGCEDSSVKIHFRSLYDCISYIDYYLVPSFDARKFLGFGGTTDNVLQHTYHRYDARGLPSFDACVGHVLSLVLQIANRCSDYWLNCKAGRIQVMKGELIEFLVNLYREIHPSNPKFMRFLLDFLMARSTEKAALVNFLESFCHYLFLGEYGHFRAEVFPLLQLFLCTTSILDDEDAAPIFIPELHAVLVEMASIFESTGRVLVEVASLGSELLSKICLLETELFLVVQIHSMKNNTNASSFSFSMLPGFEDVMDKCRQIPERLRRYSEKLPIKARSDWKKLLALIESTFEEEKSLYKSSMLTEITASTLTNSLMLLRSKIVIFEGESFLMEPLLPKSRNDDRLTVREKDLLELFLQRVEYIRQIPSDEIIKVREDVLGAIGESVRRLTCFSYYFLDTRDEMTSLSFSELLDKETHLIKAKITDIIPKFPRFDFPKTSSLNFIDLLWRNLGDLLIYNPASTALAKHHMEEIQTHLQSLRSFLENVSQLHIKENPELEDLVNRVIDAAYKAEYIIDSIEVDAQWQDYFWLDNVLEELRLLSENAGGIHLTTPDAEVQDSKNVTQVSFDRLSRKSTPAIDEIVVDLSNRENEIRNQLIRGSSKLDIVFIDGMPGLGKTTLARKVYSSLSVTSHFHLRAWCTVSQEYEKGRLLLEILAGIQGLTEEIRQMRDEELKDKLRKSLLKNKYLIVMDDIWDVGSLFSHEESWQLLEKKVFKEECCPDELLGIGKEIAYHCQGLPLAVVAVAGILKTTGKSQSSWKRIADTLSSHIIDNPEARCKEVIDLSYKHLPEYLKSCFLYLGVLNEDRDILVSKLIRFWIAEGFVPETKKKGFEDVAEAFLMDLIDRSLVIISKRRSNGKVRACRLHDLVLDFCKSKTKDENFFQLVTRSDNPYTSFPSTDYGFEFDFYHHSSAASFASYRLAIYLKRIHFVESKPSGLATRSLVFFASRDSKPERPYEVSFICHNFKLLRVLDFECFNLGISLPIEIGILVQLRYLAVGGYLKSIPQSIADLRKLKTLIVKGLSGKITLPNTIWRITSLRHLHVNLHVAFDSDAEELGDSFILENLVSFSCPSLSCGEDAERIIKRLPNLCKLSCIFYESPDSSMNCNHFPRLNCLTHLESLKIFYYGSPLNNGEFSLPLNLKKLTLSNFRLPWSHISTIGRLPNLKVLKLLSGAFEGKIWDVEEEFQNLKFLRLDNLNIAQWNASCDDFPKLERLVLQNCKDLEEIPEDFGNIYTLGMIEVHWCGRSAEESAKKIEEEYGDIEVLIRKAWCKEVTDLSYKHLPAYFKSCFLYLGVLNEDKDILVSKLMRLWVAEGFIPDTKKRFDDLAKAFLMDLIDRSLVIISKRRSNGKVRACHLHDLVLDFSYFTTIDYDFKFDFYCHSSPVSFASSRLAISLKRNHFVESKPSGLATRSLVFFASTDSEPTCPYDISFIWHIFKLLRVLDFECINLGVSFPVEIGLLLFLRYLAVGRYMRSIPHSMANLRKLETLVVKGLRDVEELVDSSANLVSFSCPSLSCGEDAERIIKRLPNLCKLSCIFYESQDSSTSYNRFPRLKFLSHLESLKIFYYGNPLHNAEFNLPLSLKELTLSRFCLPWTHISAISSLPNLEVLKLLSGAFMGRTWDMMEDEFQKLKFLSLETLDIAEWNASYDHLPRLERLVLQHCKDLEKIPEDLSDITSLETIEVHWCGQSVEESAIEIGKATGEIKVLIRSSNLRS